MYYNSPALADQMIMSKARRAGAPGADPSQIIAAHGAQQLADTAEIERANTGLDLAGRRLDESARQFDLGLGEKKRQFGTNLGLAQNALKDESTRGNWATGLSALGLGIGMADMSAQKRRANERIAMLDQSAKMLEERGDSDSLFFASMLKGIRNGY